MPKILKDEEGNDVEVMTPEEVEAEQAQAIEEAKATAKAEYDAQIQAKEEELKKLQDKVGNFEKLRSKTESQEEEEKALKADLDKVRSELGEVKSSAEQMITNHLMQSEIDRVSGGDEKLKEQIKANLELLNMPTKTNAEITAKIQRATINAQIDMGQVPNGGVLNGATITAAGGGAVKEKISGADKEELIGIASNFGISEETLKKRGKI